jgi:hypothetical protein
MHKKIEDESACTKPEQEAARQQRGKGNAILFYFASVPLSPGSFQMGKTET